MLASKKVVIVYVSTLLAVSLGLGKTDEMCADPAECKAADMEDSSALQRNVVGDKDMLSYTSGSNDHETGGGASSEATEGEGEGEADKGCGVGCSRRRRDGACATRRRRNNDKCEQAYCHYFACSAGFVRDFTKWYGSSDAECCKACTDITDKSMCKHASTCTWENNKCKKQACHNIDNKEQCKHLCEWKNDKCKACSSGFAGRRRWIATDCPSGYVEGANGCCQVCADITKELTCIVHKSCTWKNNKCSKK